MSAAKAKTKASSRIRVTLVAGWAGKSERQVRNLRTLGLRKSGDVREHEDTPTTRGVITKVAHLVRVEPVVHA